MKRILVISVLCIVATACFGQKESLLGPKDFKKIIEETKDIQLIDVRTQREYDAGKINQARLIDFYQEDFREKMGKLDKNKPIAVYCTIGGRSGAAARMLNQMGFTKVYDLRGGINDWRKAGYKLNKDD